MESTSTPPLDSPTPPQDSHGHLHTGGRLKKLLRPNGRRVHIAGTPEEHIRLTRYGNLCGYSFVPDFESRVQIIVDWSAGRSNSDFGTCAVLCQTLNQTKISIATYMAQKNM